MAPTSQVDTSMNPASLIGAKHGDNADRTCLLRLPNELLLEIFLLLDYWNLHSLRDTCQRFLLLIQHHAFDRVMFRASYDRENVQSALSQYSVAGSPGASRQNPRDVEQYVRPVDFPIKLHPALQAISWRSDENHNTIIYTWPLESDHQSRENATSPPLNFLETRVEAAAFALEPLEDSRPVSVAQALQRFRTGIDMTADGNGVELRCTVSCGGPENKSILWALEEIIFFDLEDGITDASAYRLKLPIHASLPPLPRDGLMFGQS
ncbi:hypothetical protein V8E36_000152 [Tilletia maclaganii]